MKCKNPNYIYYVDSDADNKKRVRFINGRKSIEYIEKMEGIDRSILIEVPCGNCIACRLDYSRTWANRCYLESLCHPFNWFITLTYDDEHLKFGEKGFATLEKDAISSFIRKLRDLLGHDKNIRYFGCGEYGDQTMRPHYHIIVFGPELDDLTIDIPDRSKLPNSSGKYPIFRRKNSNGDFVMYSDKVFQCWQKGKIEIEECSWNTAAYVSRYVIKKQKGMSKKVYENLGILPEMLRMSTKPGIGAEWMQKHADSLLETDYLSVKNKSGVQTSHPPRYFEKLMMKNDDVNAALMECNKTARIVNSKRRYMESSTYKSKKQQGLDQDEILQSKTKRLIRDIT